MTATLVAVVAAACLVGAVVVGARVTQQVRLSTQMLTERTQLLADRFEHSALSHQQAAAREREGTVAPLRLKLDEVQRRLEDLRVEREQARMAFGQQMGALRDQHSQITQETRRLGEALAQPAIRGRWGEMRLRSVIEAAGLLQQTEFQATNPTDEGHVRPDAVVRLPGGRVLAIDAKVPLIAGAARDTRDGRPHATALRSHVRTLAGKRYWQSVEGALELVVLFLPAEALLARALDEDEQLFGQAMRGRVLLASPTSLMALLASVAYGWRQEAVAASAAEIAQLGQELTNRARVVSEHMDRLGQRLNGAVDAYHKTNASLESRVLVTARRIAVAGTEHRDQNEPTPAAPPTERSGLHAA